MVSDKGMAKTVEEFNKAFFAEQWDKVLSLKDEVLSILCQTNSLPGQAVYFINLGITYRNLGNPNKAIECQTAALEIYKRLGDDSNVGYCYTNIGNAYQMLGKFEKAKEFHEESIAAASRAGNQSLLETAQNNLRNVQTFMKARTLR